MVCRSSLDLLTSRACTPGPRFLQWDHHMGFAVPVGLREGGQLQKQDQDEAPRVIQQFCASSGCGIANQAEGSILAA